MISYTQMEGSPGENSPQQDNISSGEKSGLHRKSTRRTFLKAGGAAVAGISGLATLRRIFREQPPQIPESEQLEDAPLRSPYFWAALSEVKKKHPEDEEKIRVILEKTDQQGAQNLSVFRPSSDPNLQIPFTKVSVNEVANQPRDKQKLIYVIFTGWAYPPTGHPFTPWDIVYDRVINSIPAIFVRNRQVEVYSIGYPQGLGGKVSREWLEGIKSEQPYKRVYGEFVNKILSENDPDTRVVLQGMSLGGSVAVAAFKNLDPEQQRRVKLLLDNPITRQSLQVPAAFAAEAFIRSQYDPRLVSAIEAEGIFLEKYKKVLSQKGVNAEDSEEQKALKEETAKAEVLNIRPLDIENTRSFIRRGVADPLSFPSAGFFRILRREISNPLVIATAVGKSLEFAINATHFINRYRVDKWHKVLKNYLSEF